MNRLVYKVYLLQLLTSGDDKICRSNRRKNSKVLRDSNKTKQKPDFIYANVLDFQERTDI